MTNVNRNVDLITAMLKKKKYGDDEIKSITDSIVSDAPLRYAESAGFGDEPESISDKVKQFGESEPKVLPDELLEIMVADNSTIEYPNDKGEQEVFAFEEQTLKSLAGKLEGVPIVMGEAHNADLPVAVFTKDSEVRTFISDGKNLKGLFAKAKVRNDKDAPVTKELFKDARWKINGGEHKLSGSLKFSSTDVPYFYEDGSKINYMTRPVPRHYALVDSPFIKESGVISKNFGENKGEIVMSTEPIVVDTPASTLPAVTPIAVAAAPIVNLAVPATPPATTPPAAKTFSVEDYDKLMAEKLELEKQLTASKRGALIEQIVHKKYGPSVEAKVRDEFVESELKAFGLPELTGYLSGLGKTITDAKPKTFGKGAVDASPAGSPIKLGLYFNKVKVKKE